MATSETQSARSAGLVPCPAPDKRTIVRSMVANGSSAAYATNLADSIHEKEQRLGVVHVDPLTRYVTRILPARASTKADAKA